MRWLEYNPTSMIREWTLLADDGTKVARVAGTGRSWRWAAGIEGLRMILHRGEEWSMEGARDCACSAVRRIGPILHASWAMQPDGSMALIFRDRTLAAAWRVPGIDAPPGEAPCDWRIPGTCIGGEAIGMFRACVVAAREAAEYWGKEWPRDSSTRAGGAGRIEIGE